MLEVQKYLLSGKTPADLESEFAITVKHHHALPLMILNYDQIKSIKIHPIVRECRGLVLDKNYNLVAKSFNRFFNFGETEEPFNFSNFHTMEKVDGSLVIIYYYNGTWHANTRGSFGDDYLNHQNFTWKEAFAKALKISSIEKLNLCKELTYICEFCSVYNKVVRIHPEPKLYLLSVFHGEKELDQTAVDSLSIDAAFHRPEKYNFNNIEEIKQFILKKEEADPTYEGFVICDDKFTRYKLKSKTYLAFHHLIDNGNIFNPKRLIDIALAGETAEMILYIPEIKELLEEVKNKLNIEYENIKNLWEKIKKIESQKDFAIIAVKETKFSNILFRMRKTGEYLEDIWRESSDMIFKVLYK